MGTDETAPASTGQATPETATPAEPGASSGSDMSPAPGPSSTFGAQGDDTEGNGGCADVDSVEVKPDGDGTYRFDVTVSSADTGWEKYADAWEVRDASGAVLGVRELAHPHVDEQPFTRSLSGVEIPEGVTTVVVAARDLVEGFCGAEQTVDLVG
jgi:hypothetical protein